MDPSGNKKNIWLLGGVFLSLLIAMPWLFRPINDPDFFWHLKTGQWIWNTHSLPLPDPFSFTTPIDLNWRQEFILSSYWLIQVIYYLAYKLGGWYGLLVLRTIFVACLLVTFHLFRQGDRLAWSVLSSVTLVLILDSFPVERPQFLSFLLFASLFLYLDKRISQGVFVAPLLERIGVALAMALWANVHGGFILGQGLLCMAGTYALICLFLNKQSRERLIESRSLFFTSMIGLLASLVNLNGFTGLDVIVASLSDKSQVLYNANTEYNSIFKIWTDTAEPVIVIYVLLMFVGLVGIVRNFKPCHLFRAGVFLGTLGASILHIRYIPFFLCAALPSMVWIVRREIWTPAAKTVTLLTGVVILVFLGRDEINNLEGISRKEIVSSHQFPVKVADQVALMGLRGRLYNPDEWGGYLIWRLGPELQVLWDGRALDESVMRDALAAKMVGIKINGQPAWRKIFEKYKIDYVILPLKENNGPSKLAMALYRDPGWKIIARDELAVFFAAQNSY